MRNEQWKKEEKNDRNRFLDYYIEERYYFSYEAKIDYLSSALRE